MTDRWRSDGAVVPPPTAQGRRAPAPDPSPEATVAAGGRGLVGPGVQGLGAGRLRARRAGHLGAPPAAPGPLLQRPGRPAPARPTTAPPSPRGRWRPPSPSHRSPSTCAASSARWGRGRHAHPVPDDDPAAAPGLQRPDADHPPRRSAGHRLHPRRHLRDGRWPPRLARPQPHRSELIAGATARRRRPARYPAPRWSSGSTSTSRSAPGGATTAPSPPGPTAPT